MDVLHYLEEIEGKADMQSRTPNELAYGFFEQLLVIVRYEDSLIVELLTRGEILVLIAVVELL
jgi:hypothetical protein